MHSVHVMGVDSALKHAVYLECEKDACRDEASPIC